MVLLQRRSHVIPWIAGAYIGASAVIVLISLLSDRPLELEGGPLDFVDAFLVFILAGLFLVLTTYGEWRTPVRASYLFATVLSLGIGVIQLVGLLDGDAPLVEELDTGTSLCWIIAGGFLACHLRSAKRIQTAEWFLIAGFALQGFSVLADVTDGMSIEMPDLFEWLFGAGEEISEVLFLVTYCCGFALLADRSTAEARRWRRQGLSAVDMLEPALVIKRAHLALRWRQRRPLERGAMVLRILAGPIGFCGELARHLSHNGPRIRRDFGKGWLRQATEVLLLGVSAGVPPASYYKFDLFTERNRKLARHFLHRQELSGRLGINRLFGRLPGPRSLLVDRFAFAAHCRQHDLPVIPVLAHGSGGKLLLTTKDGRLPQADLLAKANIAGACPSERLHWTGKDWTGADGLALDSGLVLERISRSQAEAGVILQPWRRAHPALADLACGALVSAHLITCLDESGRPEITHAILRMARGEHEAVRDFRGGGIAAQIDIADGRLGWVTDIGLGHSIGWIGLHPGSGAQIAGRVLPLWPEVRALALRAHEACLDRVVIGWDIALLAEGAELIEATAAPDLDIIQRCHSRPLGLDRLGQLIAYHVRDSLR